MYSSSTGQLAYEYKNDLMASPSVESERSTVSSWEEQHWKEASESETVEVSCILSLNREVDQLDPFLVYIEAEAERFRLEAASLAFQHAATAQRAPLSPLGAGSRQRPRSRQQRARVSRPQGAGGKKKAAARRPSVSTASAAAAPAGQPVVCLSCGRRRSCWCGLLRCLSLTEGASAAAAALGEQFRKLEKQQRLNRMRVFFR
ncbi:hypothetical protein Efla_000812 [Eimeria flavescens]